jgi:hypothetical protein
LERSGIGFHELDWRRYGEAGGLHHPLDVETFLTDALVVIEKGDAGGVDGAEEGVGEEADDLRERGESGSELAMVFDYARDCEDLGDADQSDLDDADEERQDEDAAARTFAEVDGAAEGGTSLGVLDHTSG